MCRVSDALGKRREAQDGLRDACMVHIADPMTMILDRGSVLEQGLPADMTALLVKIRRADDKGEEE